MVCAKKNKDLDVNVQNENQCNNNSWFMITAGRSVYYEREMCQWKIIHMDTEVTCFVIHWNIQSASWIFIVNTIAQ